MKKKKKKNCSHVKHYLQKIGPHSQYTYVGFYTIIYTIIYLYLYYYLSILLFKGLLLFGFLIFQFKNAPIPLCLCIEKTKGQFGKNVTLTSTKTLPKKQDKFPVNFQIVLSIYKLYCQNKNYIYKIKTQKFFFC